MSDQNPIRTNQLKKVHEMSPDELIGDVTDWAGAIAIPAASGDIHEAGYRITAGERYSEPPVEVGIFENQPELLKAFSGKPYNNVPLHFEYDFEKAALVHVSDKVRLGMDYGQQLVNAYNPEEIETIARLMQPNILTILGNYERFKGAEVEPHSLVDELADREEIEFEDRPRHTTSGLKSPKLFIELRGGEYEGDKSFYYHADALGDIGKEATAYIGSFTDKPDEPLGTYIVPGVFKAIDPSRSSVEVQEGGKNLGIESVSTVEGTINRISSLSETYHSPAPVNEQAQTRVFMRALIL